MKQTLVHRSLACALMMALLIASPAVRAGTTGSLLGKVADAVTGKPIAGAEVTAVSDSQSAAAVTDAAGRFVFISLAPDTYTSPSRP